MRRSDNKKSWVNPSKASIITLFYLLSDPKNLKDSYKNRINYLRQFEEYKTLVDYVELESKKYSLPDIVSGNLRFALHEQTNNFRERDQAPVSIVDDEHSKATEHDHQASDVFNNHVLRWIAAGASKYPIILMDMDDGNRLIRLKNIAFGGESATEDHDKEIYEEKKHNFDELISKYEPFNTPEAEYYTMPKANTPTLAKVRDAALTGLNDSGNENYSRTDIRQQYKRLLEELHSVAKNEPELFEQLTQRIKSELSIDIKAEILATQAAYGKRKHKNWAQSIDLSDENQYRSLS